MAVDKGKQTFAKAGWKSQKSSVFKTFHSLKSFLSCTLSFCSPFRSLHLQKKKKDGVCFCFFSSFPSCKVESLSHSNITSLLRTRWRPPRTSYFGPYLCMIAEFLPAQMICTKKEHTPGFVSNGFQIDIFHKRKHCKSRVKIKWFWSMVPWHLSCRWCSHVCMYPSREGLTRAHSVDINIALLRINKR